MHEVDAKQWRLAIGFKVLERRPLVRLPLAGSPFSSDYAMARLRWPGLRWPWLGQGSRRSWTRSLPSLSSSSSRPEAAHVAAHTAAQIGAQIAAHMAEGVADLCQSASDRVGMGPAVLAQMRLVVEKSQEMFPGTGEPCPSSIRCWSLS